MKKENIDQEIKIFLSYLKEKGLLEKTIKRKEEALNFFLDWVKKENLTSLKNFSKKDFTSFKKYLNSQNLSKSKKDDYLRAVSQLTEKKKGEEKESDIQKIVNYYFQTKGYTLDDIKKNAKKRKIIYSRYTRPAKDLLELAGSLEKAKQAIDKVAKWASSRNLDYAIETVFKKWPEIKKLKPKKKEKKGYYRGDPMVWSKTKNKWYVINKEGDWLEFAGKEDEVEWREEI